MSTNEKAAFALLFQYIYINYVISMRLLRDSNHVIYFPAVI